MTAVERLPADQRAVLELVLARRRTYDEIARLLAMDRAGVRERALAALDALTPPVGIPPERRALITDYLLGQLPERLRQEMRGRLAREALDAAWARAAASELSDISGAVLPEIPAANDLNGTGPPRPTDAGEPPAAEAPATGVGDQADGPRARPDSRIVMLVVAVVIVVVVIVLIIGLTSGASHRASASAPPLGALRLAAVAPGGMAKGTAEAVPIGGRPRRSERSTAGRLGAACQRSGADAAVRSVPPSGEPGARAAPALG